jgi:hypothetical protein
MKQKWLCVDRKCIYAKVSKIKVRRAPFPRASFGVEIEQLEVYCRKHHTFVRQWVTSCRDFQNTRLMEVTKTENEPYKV